MDYLYVFQVLVLLYKCEQITNVCLLWNHSLPKERGREKTAHAQLSQPHLFGFLITQSCLT